LAGRARAFYFQSDLEQMSARGDAHSAIIGVAKRQMCGANAVARLAGRLGEMPAAQGLAFRRRNLNPAPGVPPLVVYRFPFVSLPIKQTAALSPPHV
jgi:hypothetical protein